MALDFLWNSVRDTVLRDVRVADLINFSGGSPGGNIGAVVAWTPAGFPAFETVLHEAGYTGLRFTRRDGALDFYE
jgi:hypothetical protein